MARKINVIRPSKEMMYIINFIRAKYIMDGKVPPSIAKITMVIAKKNDKEELFNDCIIRF